MKILSISPRGTGFKLLDKKFEAGLETIPKISHERCIKKARRFWYSSKTKPSIENLKVALRLASGGDYESKIYKIAIGAAEETKYTPALDIWGKITKLFMDKFHPKLKWLFVESLLRGGRLQI